MILKLHKNKNKEIYVLECAYDQRGLARKGGLKFSGVKSPKYIPENVWFTKDLSIAYNFYEYADPSMKKKLDEFKSNIASSRVVNNEEINIPSPPGLSYKNYQKTGINYALQRKHTIIADEMGLGKSIQAIGYMNAKIDEIKKCIIFCPASIKLNWQRECEKWLIKPKKIQVLKTLKDKLDANANIFILNYELVQEAKPRKKKNETDEEFIIRAKEEMKAKSVSDQLKDLNIDLIVLDEVHYIKNEKSKRTIEILGKRRDSTGAKKGLVHLSKNVLALTGTPVQNKPIEIFPLVHALYPKDFSSYWGFAKEYQGAYQSVIYGGRKVWTIGEPRNLNHLQNKLRNLCMIRRLKEDVLKELPPKVRNIITIENDNNKIKIDKNFTQKILDLEKDISKKYDNKELSENEIGEMKNKYEHIVNDIMSYATINLGELQSQRTKISLLKLPAIFEHIEELLEQDEKVVVFCVTHKIIDEIFNKYKEIAVKIDGRDDQKSRQESVDKFQKDDNIKVFIGNIKAAGVGLTLTRASHVLFAELDWVPASIYQAEDRCHRMGQDSVVFTYHYVLQDTFDEVFIKTIVNKQNIFDKMMDTESHNNEEYIEKNQLLLDNEYNDLTIEKEHDKESATEVTPFTTEELFEKFKFIKGVIFGDENKNIAKNILEKECISLSEDELEFMKNHIKNRVAFFSEKDRKIIEKM